MSEHSLGAGVLILSWALSMHRLPQAPSTPLPHPSHTLSTPHLRPTHTPPTPHPRPTHAPSTPIRAQLHCSLAALPPTELR